MPSTYKTPIVLMFAAVAVIGAGVGLWFAHHIRATEKPVANQQMLRDGPLLRLPEPKPIADFELYDDAGGGFSRVDIEGRWTVVFFGFSSCPHICPDTLYQLTLAVDALRETLPPERVPGILFIGVDPERDTPEALNRYRARFENAIEAVSGEDAQLRALAMQLGVHYVVPEHEKNTWYNVDHSLSVLLLDPQAQWVGVLSAPHDGEAMSEALRRFIADA
jgi:protein SCO1/2